MEEFIVVAMVMWSLNMLTAIVLDGMSFPPSCPFVENRRYIPRKLLGRESELYSMDRLQFLFC